MFFNNPTVSVRAMKRLAVFSILSLLFSGVSLVTAQAEPVKKTEIVEINYTSGSSDIAFPDIERII